MHCAILNDFARLYTDRPAAWAGYVGATRNVVDAAAGAQVVLVSTDWVFDGTQSGAREDEPPNPINAYGFLKAASELVVAERAERGAVARISGVQGIHRARPDTPRAQDAGFGYLVASLVDALSAGRRFTVWDAPDINVIATPTLATDAAELIRRMIELGADRHPPLLRRRGHQPHRAGAPRGGHLRARRLPARHRPAAARRAARARPVRHEPRLHGDRGGARHHAAGHRRAAAPPEE